jgi:hypothetical protein
MSPVESIHGRGRIRHDKLPKSRDHACFEPRNRVIARTLSPLFKKSTPFNHAIDMAHMGPAEGYKEEFSSEDDTEVVHSKRNTPLDTDKYIESKVTCGKHYQ